MQKIMSQIMMQAKKWRLLVYLNSSLSGGLSVIDVDASVFEASDIDLSSFTVRDLNVRCTIDQLCGPRIGSFMHFM